MASAKKINSIAISLFTLASCYAHYYLTKEHFLLKYTHLEGGQLCSVSDYLNCSGAITSSFSEVFGIPISIFGFYTNLILFVVLLISLFSLSEEKQEQFQKVTSFFILLTVGASVVMGAISLFILKSLCPICLSTYVFSFLILFFWWRHAPKAFWPLTLHAKPLAISLVALVGFSFVTHKMVASKFKLNDFKESVELRIMDWKNKPFREISSVAPVKMGPDSAKMKIVEFADFLCIHCKLSYHKIHVFLKTHPDAQLLFHSFPLDGCQGTDDAPGKRCQMARLQYCSDQQGKGMETQALLFSEQETNHRKDFRNMAKDIAEELSMDLTKLNECLSDSASLKIVRDQIQLGKDLGVKGTPGFFINGKSLPGAGNLPVLEAAYEEIMSSK